METKINLVLLMIVVGAWAAMTAVDPARALEPSDVDVGELAVLEDAFATQRGDADVARELAERYLEISQPALAISALGSAPAEVREDPAVLHRLAQAYEATGRMQDAFDTASLALARCERALGTRRASSVTPVPTHGCSERTYAALDYHMRAVGHLVRMGVVDPQNDPRTVTAYNLAIRSARVLSAQR